MSKRYDEIMDKVEVTDEMRSRILQNIEQAGIANTKAEKIIRFPNIKKYLSIAACFAVLIVGALSIPQSLHQEQGTDQSLMGAGAGIVTVSSAEELSDTVNFDVDDITGLPFLPIEQTYIAYWNELAQIIYTGEGQTAVFRKSIGNDDNSGDFNTYQTVEKLSVDEVTVTLKGNNDIFTLAVWSKNDFSYSLQISSGLTLEEWETLIVQIN